MQKEYNIQQIVGSNLRSLRNRQHISQLELSSRTGFSHTFINNIENGKKWISAHTLSVLCQVLNAYPFEFFLTEDIPDKETGYQAQKMQDQMIQELNEVIARYHNEGENIQT